jgi:tetratricopeptide (TPR) repeat protein
MFDREAAASLFARALAAWRRLPPGLAARFDAEAAFATAADVELTEGREAAAAALFREAASVSRTPAEIAHAYTLSWWLPYRHGDFEAARAILEEGLARMPPDACAARAELRRDIGWCLVRLRRLAEAEEVLQEVKEILGAGDDRREAMKAFDSLGSLLSQMGRHPDAIAHLERSLAIAMDTHDSRGEMLARLHLGAALHRSGCTARGRVHLEKAIELARLIGDRYAESVGVWSSARVLDALGDHEAAADHRRRELVLLASLGGNPHNEALAHAHLARLGTLGVPGIVAEAEATAARRLAARSPDPAYPARIELALSVRDWSEVDP